MQRLILIVMLQSVGTRRLIDVLNIDLVGNNIGIAMIDIDRIERSKTMPIRDQIGRR